MKQLHMREELYHCYHEPEGRVEEEEVYLQTDQYLPMK